MRLFFSLALVALLAGCQTAPKPAPAVITPAHVAPAPKTETAVVPTEVLPQRTEAALEARDLLLKGDRAHQVLMQSAFRQTPGFNVAGWSGLVLSPKDLRQGIVVGSGYRIYRVEIHPLADGRLRVWVEVGNTSNDRRQPEGTCEFRPVNDAGLTKFKPLPALEPGAKELVSFESTHAQIEGYSILVRSKR